MPDQTEPSGSTEGAKPAKGSGSTKGSAADRRSAAADRPTYEQARSELVDIVRALENGGQTLEESLALWERGETLADVCQQWLDGARATIEDAVARRRTPAAADDDA